MNNKQKVWPTVFGRVPDATTDEEQLDLCSRDHGFSSKKSLQWKHIIRPKFSQILPSNLLS